MRSMFQAGKPQQKWLEKAWSNGRIKNNIQTKLYPDSNWHVYNLNKLLGSWNVVDSVSLELTFSAGFIYISKKGYINLCFSIQVVNSSSSSLFLAVRQE